MTQRFHAPNFENPRLALIWAGLSTCEVDEMLEFVLQLNTMLGNSTLPVTRSKNRQADAIACLREAAQELGHSPSLRDYEELRKSRPDLDLVPAGSIRTRLAGGWNDCLGRAQLDAVPDTDLPLLAPSRFSEEEMLEALRNCERDLGHVPTVFSYRCWTMRPDVRERDGRRPLTEGPFKRQFGSFPAALRAAGIVGDSVCRRGGRIEPSEWSYDEGEVLQGLRRAYKQLGFSPTVSEYDEVRRAVRREVEEGADVPLLAAPSTIAHRYRTWAAALEAAGLPPRRVRRRGRRKPTEPLYSDEAIEAALRTAYLAVGEPFTEDAYTAWRTRELLREGVRPHSFPSVWTVKARLRGWYGACERALKSHAVAPAETVDDVDGGEIAGDTGTRGHRRVVD